jgi:hypothetical protein
MTTLPVDFAAKVKAPPGASGGGYPVQISSADLMKNFSWAALDADPSLIEQTTAAGGHKARKLKIPAVPASGTHVLGAVNGVVQWIATEEC